jgi:hypothetical protein
MGLFDFISQGCQSLAATAAPSITAMGVHIVLSLATIILVWFGVQEALASAQGGAGFSMGRFLNLFMLLTFAYASRVHSKAGQATAKALLERECCRQAL